MEVERVERKNNTTVECLLTTQEAPGLLATAYVGRNGPRLVVTQLWIDQDPYTGDGPTEITRDALRQFDPPVIVRALADYIVNPAPELIALATKDGAADLREWFGMVDAALGSDSGSRFMAQIDAAAQVVQEATVPRRGRPPKFTDDELVSWAASALRLDAAHPKSLHAQLAAAMSASGRVDLAHSTPSNARDLLKTLRKRGYLQPARTSGAREPIAPGPRYRTERGTK